MGRNAFDEIFMWLDWRNGYFTPYELEPYNNDIEMYLSSKGISNQIFSFRDILGDTENSLVWLSKICNYNEEMMVDDLMSALYRNGYRPDIFDAMLNYVNGDTSRFTEYQIRLFWRYARGGKDDQQILSWVNNWRTAHGYDAFENMRDIESNFQPEFNKVLYTVARFKDYNGGKTLIEPQDVHRIVLTNNRDVEIETSGCNRINYVLRDYDTLYDGGDDNPSKYTVDVECEGDNIPYFHLVYYETIYDKDEALDRLSPTGKALYYAFKSFAESLNAPLVKGMETILSDGNYGTLHRSVSALQMALNRLETALRENGVY